MKRILLILALNCFTLFSIQAQSTEYLLPQVLAMVAQK